jgi:RNA polymerase sigma-70 factor (ECF subfamily)
MSYVTGKSNSCGRFVADNDLTVSSSVGPIERFHTLYVQHYGELLAYARRRLRGPDEAQDAVAEVFTSAWRNIDQLPLPPDDLLWLYGAARHVVARHHRSNQRRSRLSGRLANERPIVVAGEDSMLDVLRVAIEKLPYRDREALRLVMWEQLPHDEAARVLGCSTNALDVRLHRARKRLRRVLDKRAVDIPTARGKGESDG